MVFSVCYSDKHFVNSSLENPYLILAQEKKSVQNFRTFTLVPNSDVLAYMLLDCLASQD